MRKHELLKEEQGRLCAGGKNYCGGLGMGKKVERCREAGLTQPLRALGSPAWMGSASALHLEDPIGRLVLEAAFVKHPSQSAPSAGSTGRSSPVVRWWDRGLVAKLLLEQSFS